MTHGTFFGGTRCEKMFCPFLFNFLIVHTHISIYKYICVYVYIITVHMQCAPLLSRCCVLLNAIFVHTRHEKKICPFVFNFCIAQTRISVYIHNANAYALCECYCHAAICYFRQYFIPSRHISRCSIGRLNCRCLFKNTKHYRHSSHSIVNRTLLSFDILCAAKAVRRLCQERLPKYMVYISQLTSISRRYPFYLFIITESNIRNVKYRSGVRNEAMVCMSCHILLYI